MLISLVVHVLRMIVETSARRSSSGKAGLGMDQQREPQHFKGETMKKKYTSILLTLMCGFGLAVAAKAQYRSEAVVTLPFEFVVSGKTLPAGTYRVSRISQDRFVGLLFSSYENRASVFIHPVEVETARSHSPGVTFERVGEQYFLSRIQTTNDVYNIPVSRSAIMEAAARSHDSGSAEGSSGSK
jgi:hypothetical protein